MVSMVEPGLNTREKVSLATLVPLYGVVRLRPQAQSFAPIGSWASWAHPTPLVPRVDVRPASAPNEIRCAQMLAVRPVLVGKQAAKRGMSAPLEQYLPTSVPSFPSAGLAPSSLEVPFEEPASARKSYRLSRMPAPAPAEQEQVPQSQPVVDRAPAIALAAPRAVNITHLADPLPRQLGGKILRPRGNWSSLGKMPYGWLASYTAAANRQMQPAEGNWLAASAQLGFRFAPSSPILIGALKSLHSREFKTAFPGKLSRRIHASPWLLITLIGGTILGAGFVNMFSVSAQPPARPPQSAVQSSDQSFAQSPLQAAPLAASIDAQPTFLPPPANALSRAIEVSGVRVTIPKNGKPEIQYIVVSHSTSHMAGINVYVTLHDLSAPPGQPPLCQFSFVTPDLEPNEAKQMSNTIEGARKAVRLPDWRDLRVDVQVGQ